MKETNSYSIPAIALKGVSRKLFRNLILLLAVAMLVGLLVFAMLFNKAVEEDLDAAARKLGADLVIVPQGALTKAEEFILESKEKTFYMDKFVYEAVKDLEEVEAATYQIYLQTLDSECCSIEEGQVIAFDQKTDFVIKSWMTSPPVLNKGDVYIGNYIYYFLGLINTAKLFGTGVNIVSHLDATDTGMDQGIFMREEDLEMIAREAKGDYKPGLISIVFLKLKEGVDPNLMADKVQAINPKVGVMTRGSIGGGIRETLKDIVKIFSITIFISSILAILLTWSTFTAMANERKREVGILRALGAQKLHIIKLFLTEAFIVSSIGGIIGVLTGHYLISHLAKNFHLLTRLDIVSQITVNNILVSFFGISIGIGVCLLGALIPTMRLAKLEPLEAIKQD